MGHFWKIVACVAATLATPLFGKPALAAPPNSECLSALIAAFEGTADASSCPFLHMEDGRFIGVSGSEGVFFVGPDKGKSVYVGMVRKTRTILISRTSQKPWKNPITGRQTSPDAKHFYFPFFGPNGSVSKRNHPTNLRVICPDPKTLSLADNKRCED